MRPATIDDIPELVRLRALMFASMGSTGDGWQDAAARDIAERLKDGTMRVYVVDGEPGLAACAIGVVDRRVPGPGTPNGRWGHISGVATDPAYRRRGYARLLTQALLGWFEANGVRRVELHATAAAEPLYRELGFVDQTYQALTWRPPAED